MVRTVETASLRASSRAAEADRSTTHPVSAHFKSFVALLTVDGSTASNTLTSSHHDMPPSLQRAVTSVTNNLPKPEEPKDVTFSPTASEKVPVKTVSTRLGLNKITSVFDSTTKTDDKNTTVSYPTLLVTAEANILADGLPLAANIAPQTISQQSAEEAANTPNLGQQTPTEFCTLTAALETEAKSLGVVSSEKEEPQLEKTAPQSTQGPFDLRRTALSFPKPGPGPAPELPSENGRPSVAMDLTSVTATSSHLPSTHRTSTNLVADSKPELALVNLQPAPSPAIQSAVVEATSQVSLGPRTAITAPSAIGSAGTDITTSTSTSTNSNLASLAMTVGLTTSDSTAALRTVKPSPLPTSTLATSPLPQVASVLAELTRTPADGTMTLRLDPEELGKVQIRIERGIDGTASVYVAAERQETLRLLLADQQQLHRTLDNAGVPQKGRSLSLALSPPDATPASGLISRDILNTELNNGSSRSTNTDQGGFNNNKNDGHRGSHWHQDRVPYANTSDAESVVISTVLPKAGVNITA